MASKTKKSLGKGINDLFGVENMRLIEQFEEAAKHKEVIEVEINKLYPNPFQPRKTFDDQKLEELAESIRSVGVLTPILITKTVNGYYVIAGERRWRAASLAGKMTIPATVHDLSDKQMAEIAIIENVQREDLNAVEEAISYKAYMDLNDCTQEELARAIGKSRSHIANILRILSLPDFIQTAVLEGKITMGHARAMIAIDDMSVLKRLLNRIINEKLSVRSVEQIVRGYELSKFKKAKPKAEVDIFLKDVENKMVDKFKTKVKIENKEIKIKFHDDRDLNRILDILNLIED